MPAKEKKLCAPKDELSSLISLGEEFAKGMKKQAKEFQAEGKDTTYIDGLLADLSKRLGAHKRALRL